MIEKIIGHMKARATQQLKREKLHPFERVTDGSGDMVSVWTHRAWKVFLNSSDGTERAIQYVRENPTKEGKREQYWSFVKA